MRLLLAIDGSDQSYDAVRAVARLPVPEQLVLVHALDVLQPTYPMMMPEAARHLYDIVEQDMREDGIRLAERVASLLPGEVKPAATYIEPGTPAELIISVAEKERVDLIIMGARGLGPFQETVFGSVSHRVATHAPCSVLVVRSPIASLRQALLAVEGREDADVAIQFMAKKPFNPSTFLEVLTVVQIGNPLGRRPDAESLREMTIQSAQRFVEDIAAKISRFRCCATAATATGTPAAAIVEHAASIKADMLLLGSRARSGISRFLLGSVSHAVLHRSPTAVLIYR